MKEKLLKLLKVLFKLLPMIINLLDEAGNKMDSLIKSNRKS